MAHSLPPWEARSTASADDPALALDQHAPQELAGRRAWDLVDHDDVGEPLVRHALTELAARADMTHQSMSELVAGMERRGWVQRRPDPTDHRARLVCLTPAGRDLARRGLHHINEIEAKWQARWRAAGYDGRLRDVLEQAIAGEERERAERQTTSAAT
jgi:DNA-binding MarR family transcriptional regulator